MNPIQHSLALRVILLTALSVSYHTSQAATACHTLTDSSQRLACYDLANGVINDQSSAVIAVPIEPVAAPIVAIATPATAANTTTTATGSIIDTAWGFDPASDRHSLGMYGSNYILLGRYSDRTNEAPYKNSTGKSIANLDDVEVKFQISLKARLWTTDDHRWGLWGAYTQNNNWQIYNKDESRPFRETNYMPELILSFRPDVNLGAGFNWRLLNAGYTHQSNGSNEVISRSWDRLFAEIGVDNGDFALYGKAWYRLPESDGVDQNPTILDNYGHGQLNAVYRWNGHSFTGLIRGNLKTGKGAVQIGWYSPPILGPLRAYVQGFSGYGETLIDYDWRQNTIGAGFALNDGF